MVDSIAVVKDDTTDKWLIVTNPRITKGSGFDGNQSERGQTRIECDFVWNGDRWSSDWDDAMQFDDREMAEVYYQDHAGRIDG